MNELRETESVWPVLPNCWLCGDPVPAVQEGQLLIDDVYQVLHRDCIERVKKSADV